MNAATQIVAGETDPHKPDKIKLLMPTRDDPTCINTRRWFYYDPDRPDLIEATAAYVVELASRHGNVFCGVRLYDKRAKAQNTRKEEYTRPSRVVVIDDAQPDPTIPYTTIVRTSEGSRHAYYKADRPVTKDDARRAAAANGGDPSGIDLTQLVRVPGTFNTKNGGRFLVHSEPGQAPIYRLDDLRAAWPEVASARGTGAIAALDCPEVEIHLANLQRLYESARFALIKPETQTGRILAGEMLCLPSQKYGRMDDSRSMNACAVALGLLLRGFPDEEISAVLFDLYQKWGSERDKGTAWVKLDIGRILAYCHEQHSEVKQSPTRYHKAAKTQPIADVQPVSRARSDRPQRFTPALFAQYQDRPEVCTMKRRQRAASLAISTATLDRLEKELRKQELIEVETDPHRQGSRVILIGVINIPAPDVLSRAIEPTADEAPFASAESAQTDDRTPQCIGGTHPPPDSPRSEVAVPDFTSAGDGPRLTLEALVHEAFDAYPGRASLRKVRAYVEANRNGSNWSDVAIVDWYGREKKRRQRARQDAREAEKARQLRWSALVRKSQNLASQAAAMLRRGDPRGPIWERRAGIYAAEEARREAAGEAPSERLKPKRKPRGYTSAESDAWLAAKGAQVRAPWDDQGVTGGVCPP